MRPIATHDCYEQQCDIMDVSRRAKNKGTQSRAFWSYPILSCNRGALISTVLQQITLLETIYPERAKYHDYIISSQWLSSINSIPCVLKLVVVLQQRYTNVSQFPRPICYWKWGGEPVYTNIKGVKADDSTWNNNLLSGPCIISTMWSQWLS